MQLTREQWSVTERGETGGERMGCAMYLVADFGSRVVIGTCLGCERTANGRHECKARFVSL